MPTPNEAQINLTVDAFVANAANPGAGVPVGPFCRPTALAFVLDGHGNPVDASGQVRLEGANIVVTRIGPGNHPILLQLNLDGAAGPLAAQKIVFSQSNLGGDLDGTLNLDARQCAGPVVSFRNKWIMHGPKRGFPGNMAPAWKYFIRVQQTASGQFGWIDPDLENQD